MLKTLTKKTAKSLLPLICAVLFTAGLLLGLSGLGAFRLALGAKDISAIDENSLSGKYVSFDASSSIAAYASYGSDGNYKKQYYVLRIGDKYMSITATDEYYDQLEAASDQSQEYYQGELTELSSLGTVKGTVAPLEDDLRDMLITGISDISLPGAETEEEAAANVLPYTVKLGYVGWVTDTVAIVLTVLALVFLIWGILLIILVNKGFYCRGVTKGRSEAELEEAEKDFETAIVHDRVIVGNKYIWYFKGPKCTMIPAGQVIWGYCEANPQVVSKYQWPMAMYLQDKTYHSVALETKDEIAVVLDEIAALGHPFVQGYDSNKNKMFKNDFAAFMELAKENKR